MKVKRADLLFSIGCQLFAFIWKFYEGKKSNAQSSQSSNCILDFDVYQSLQRIFKRTTLSVNAGTSCRMVPHRAVDLLLVDGIGERLHGQL